MVTAVAALAACSASTPGNPVPDGVPAPSTSEAPSRPADLAATDACTLLGAAELAQLGMPPQPAERSAEDGGTFCGWTAGPVRVLVAVGPGTPDEAQMELQAPEVAPAVVAGYEGRRLSGGGPCGFVFELQPGTVLVVAVGSSTPGYDGCPPATRAAEFALARLPG